MRTAMRPGGSDTAVELAFSLFLFPLGSALFFECLGRLLLVFFLSIHAFAHDSHSSVLKKTGNPSANLQVLAGRPTLSFRVNILRSTVRGGFGGFSLTLVIRNSRPATKTFCSILNISFGMPSGKSTKL